jgi:hypothetical protein
MSKLKKLKEIIQPQYFLDVGIKKAPDSWATFTAHKMIFALQKCAKFFNYARKNEKLF